jgi:hypothetical protein
MNCPLYLGGGKSGREVHSRGNTASKGFSCPVGRLSSAVSWDVTDRTPPGLEKTVT